MTKKIILPNGTNFLPQTKEFDKDDFENYLSTLDSVDRHYAIKEVNQRIVDTITYKSASGVEFNANYSVLMDKPLINDSEILAFSSGLSELYVKPRVGNIISEYKRNMDGKQFVITVNKEPQLTGYFYSDLSTKSRDWNHIIYNQVSTRKLDDPKTNEYSIINITKPLYKNIDLSEYPKIKSALIESDRLIK